MQIAIDHGNHSVKTINHAFVSNFIERKKTLRLQEGQEDILEHCGTEFVISENSTLTRHNKTLDEHYYVLTLFAIGKEFPQGGNLEIDLIIGLPLSDFADGNKEALIDYFKQKALIKFRYSGVDYSVKFKSISVYPQTVAAVFYVFHSEGETKSQISKIRQINFIDIGGGTVNFVLTNNQVIDRDASGTLGRGVNTMFVEVNKAVSASRIGRQKLRPNDIQDILKRNTDEGIPTDIAAIIKDAARDFADKLLLEVASFGINLHDSLTIFLGGGSLLLEDFIRKSNYVSNPQFLYDVNINAKGFEVMRQLAQGMDR